MNASTTSRDSTTVKSLEKGIKPRNTITPQRGKHITYNRNTRVAHVKRNTQHASASRNRALPTRDGFCVPGNSTRRVNLAFTHHASTLRPPPPWPLNLDSTPSHIRIRVPLSPRLKPCCGRLGSLYLPRPTPHVRAVLTAVIPTSRTTCATPRKSGPCSEPYRGWIRILL